MCCGVDKARSMEKCCEKVGCWKRKWRLLSGRLGTALLGLARHVGSWIREKSVLLGIQLFGRGAEKLTVGSSKCGGIVCCFVLLSRV